MSDSRPAPTSALPQRRTTPTLADLAPHYPEPKELQDLLPKEAYIIEGFLGQGGMGAVYKGIQISLNRPVAVKVMELGIGEQYDYADRFRREAQAMAAMNHPHIVNVIDFGMAAGKYLYIVMEFIDGSDLHHVIKAGQMTPELALYLVPQICEALAYAHEHGIVHRDIKPANIMLTRDWRVKVADFGLAKRFDANSTLMTRSNLSMGTPDYAAPEQFKEPASVDHRADIYALGVTFYQMLTGELPRGAWQPPSVAAKMDQRLDPIVIKAMMPKREERYQSARELQQSVIGFSQMLAWEYQNKTALEAAQKAQAQQQTAHASAKVATAQVPKPQKPVGKIASPSAKAVEQPKHEPPATKQNTPLFLGIGAAAVLGISAFAWWSAQNSERNQELITDTSSTAQGTERTTLPPAATPIKVIDTKPAATSTPGASALTLDPAIQAKLDAVPWVKFDLSKPLIPHFSNPKGTAGIKNGQMEIKDAFFLRVLEKAGDVAVRLKVAAHPGENGLWIDFRSQANAHRVAAGREGPRTEGKLKIVQRPTNESQVMSPPFDLPPPGTAYTLEAFAIGDAYGCRVDGQMKAFARDSSIPADGAVTLFAQDALIEFIEYKVLDGVAAPPVVAAKTAEWKKLDLSGKLEPAYSLSSMPADASATFKDGLLELKRQFYILAAKNCRDVAVRVRLTPNPSEENVQINLRAITPGKRLSTGRSKGGKALGHLLVHDSTSRQNSGLAADFSVPPRGTAWTLETFALGTSFGTFVDGNLAAYAESSEMPHAGNAQVMAQHAQVESIEYLVLDGVPREQWPAHIREAVETKGKPAPLAQSQISNPESQISLDAPGWKRLDLAKVQEEPGKVERLPDGAVRLTKGYVWTDTGYSGDVAIRACFRGGSDGLSQRVILRDDAQVGYSANIPGVDRKAGRLIVYPQGKAQDALENKLLAEFTPPNTTQTFTLELRAQGSTLTVFVDGKQVAQAQDDQLKFGRLGVFADLGIVEGIAYQAGDAAAPADDDAGWQKMDFAKVTLEPGKRDRLPDGALKLSRNFVWFDQHYEDVQVRVRFRAGIGRMDNPRVLVRESEGVAYSLAGDAIYRQIYGYEAREQGGKSTELVKLDKMVRNMQTLELHVRGDQLTGFINGEKVAEARDDMLKSGRVGFYANEGIVESFEIKPFAKDRATVKPGELVWKTQVVGNINGPASQGADGTVYVATNAKQFVALNPKDGSILWTAPLAGEVRTGVAPVVADDGSVLIVVHGTVSGSEGKGVLHCVDGKTGKERWTFAFDEGGAKSHFADSSVAVSADGKVYLSHKAAYCIDLATGGQLWTTAYPNETSNCAPVIAPNGIVIFPAGGVVLAMNPLNGSILWQARLVGACYGDPALDGNTLFIAGVNSGSTPGSLRAYDTRTGQMRWENKLGDKLDASLALDAQGRVFTVDAARKTIACDVNTGTTVWSADHGPTSATRHFTIGADGFIYTSFDKDIVCLKPDNGEIVWSVPTKDVIWSVPLLLDDGLLITGSRDHYLYAIQTSSQGLADSAWPTMGQNSRRNGRAKDAQVIVLQDTPTDKKLREIEAKARAEYDAGPGKVFTDATATLRAQYTNALKARAAQSQQGGHLDHMLAFQQEAEAFAAGTITAPPADAPSTPEPLKQLRETFRKTMAGHEATRDKAAAPIYAKWDAALDLLQKDLTKTGEINEALRVKKLRDQIVTTKALTVATIGNRSLAPAPTAPPSRPTTTTKAPAPKLAKVDDREIAEWVLSIPGSKIQYFNSAGNWSSDVTSADKLQRGDFKLAKVQLASGANVKEADLLRVASLERLHVLSIESNGFTCYTPAVIAALAQAPEFRDLKIKGSNLEDADFAPLAGKKMTRFMVDECPKFTGKALAYFTDDPIRELGLKSCPITEDAFEHIAQMKDLERAEFHSLKAAANVLARIPVAKLLHLELNNMKHLSGSLGFLTRFDRLERVFFGYWDGLSEDDVKVLAQMKSLQKVSVPGMRDETIARLSTIPRLTEIGISPYYGTGKNLSVLALLKGLRRLELNGTTTKITDEGLAALASLPQLEDLDFNSAPLITDAGLAEVAKLTKLLKLNLKATKITDTGLEPLKSLRKLETLDLTGTQVTPAGAAAIQKALPKCKVWGP